MTCAIRCLFWGWAGWRAWWRGRRAGAALGAPRLRCFLMPAARFRHEAIADKQPRERRNDDDCYGIPDSGQIRLALRTVRAARLGQAAAGGGGLSARLLGWRADALGAGEIPWVCDAVVARELVGAADMVSGPVL